MATLGDEFKLYIKPSLKGELVIRKRNSNQSSLALKKWQLAVAEAKPAISAHQNCSQKRKVMVYKPGQGYVEVERCTIQSFKAALRQQMISLAKSSAAHPMP